MHQFAEFATQLRHFLNKKILTFGSSPLLHLAKSWLLTCLRVYRGVDNVLLEHSTLKVV